MPRTPDAIKLHKQSRTLELQFGADTYTLTAELLRVYSPSAEVQGHGPGQEVLQHGKRLVGISRLEASGNYGLRIYFDDNHDSGIFTWDYLQKLGSQQQGLMLEYEQKLHAAGLTREADTQVVRLMDP